MGFIFSPTLLWALHAFFLEAVKSKDFTDYTYKKIIPPLFCNTQNFGKNCTLGHPLSMNSANDWESLLLNLKCRPIEDQSQSTYIFLLLRGINEKVAGIIAKSIQPIMDQQESRICNQFLISHEIRKMSKLHEDQQFFSENPELSKIPLELKMAMYELY